MNIRKFAGAALAAAIGLTAVSATAETVYIDEDFQSEAVGTNPKSARYLAVKGTDAAAKIVVVDADSDPADPFGGEGNQSLLIQDDDEKLTGWFGIVGSLPKEGIAKATLTLKFVVHDMKGHNKAFGQVRMGLNADQGGGLRFEEIGPAINWVGNQLYYNTKHPEKDGFKQQPLDQKIEYDTVYELEMVIAAESQTYSMKLDGEPLTAKGGQVTEFEFVNSTVGAVNDLELISGWSRGMETQNYFDDVKLVGE